MSSLQRHLQVWLALSLIVLMGLFWILENQSIKSITEGFLISRLEHDGDNLLLALAPNETNKIDIQRINPIYKQPSSGHYYAIHFANGEQLASPSLEQHVLPASPLETGETKLEHIDGPFGQHVLLWSKGFQKGGFKFTIAVAEDLTVLKQQRQKFIGSFTLLALAGLITLLAVQSLVVRRSIKKLDPVRDDIKRLEHGEISKLSEDVPDEIQPIIQEFNHILKLLSQRLDRSRNALGNLAHALKGPLSILTQYCDASKSGMNSEQVNQAGVQIERIQQLMERELKRARLAGKEMSTQRFNPQLNLPNLLDVLGQIHSSKSLSIEYQVDDDVPAFGDLEDIYELLGNLLDNACKWAKSSVNCHISGHDEVQILIEDDGAGLTREELEQLSQRGVRLDEAVEGHGLGLSIAKDIAKLYGGQLHFSCSEKLGGLKIKVLLPLT